ncbi:DNA topoisomerase 3-alpha [Bienertia sinuspersici]
MSSRKQSPNASGSYASGSSSISKRDGQSRIRCRCGKDAVVRTVRQGPNLGMKFYGCPSWPDTQCDMFRWVNQSINLDDYAMKILEKETIIHEMEAELKTKDEKIKKLQLNKENLEEDVQEMKFEVSCTRIELIKSARNEKNLMIALVLSWLFFVIILLLWK